MFDFNSLLPDNAARDHARGYEIAALAAALIVDEAIKKAFPNETPDFYKGVIDGIRQEI